MKYLEESELEKKRSRRLRKKLRVGEFQELGVGIRFLFAKVSFDEALDHWIDYVEENHWQFGGGGESDSNQIEGFLANLDGQSLTPADLLFIEKWFSETDWIADYKIGELKDVWHNPELG